MTVKRIASPRKYIGLSTDTKPVTDTTDAIPSGSEFYEFDSGILYQWTAYEWIAVSTGTLLDDRQLNTLREILVELRDLNELHREVVARI